MTNLVLHRNETQAIALPEPRGGAINIRQAVLGGADLKFIDDLQKKHTKMVGWMPTNQLETNIKNGKVLIAEQGKEGIRHQALGTSASSNAQCLVPNASPVGYCISHDRYFKRDDCGIVYQLNVLPGKHRGLIGATLIKAVFDRAAYGCKLFCCWCAQDLQANYFWESLGFVPLAFRTGSRGTKRSGVRIHIFWQRRVREGDVETPYWFPSETTGGALKENRIVLPLPPGTNWQDAKPALLPGMENVNMLPAGEGEAKAPKQKTQRVTVKKVVMKQSAIAMGGLRFTSPVEVKKAEKVKQPKQKFKNDPKLVDAARELRDKYLEQVNSGLMLPAANGKYEVSRLIEAAPFRGQGAGVELKQLPLLKAA